MQECRITQEAGNALDLRVWCMPILFHETTYSIMVAQNIENEKRREILEKTFFHDLLNTINGLVGLIDLLKETSENNCDDFRDLLDISTRTLIEEIYAQKDLMSAESNNLQIIKSSFNSFSALEETAAIYKRHEVTGEKNISIDPTSCQIKIFTDKGLLTRTIGNMIKNALEASHNGETVTLGCKQTDEKNIEFWVHNKRPMSREAQLQVFQRSYSTKGKGHGIGTWSVKLLTEQYLNGKASFTSSEEEGTIFRISIPIGSKSDLDILE
jgi:signal transduction histidine kinase